ncbi:trypsin-like peptidase domain-containing protein [Streptomyces sp. NPDC002490]|uniref:VMAP-C domain-containing protein n=1 Tax=Streptomyces sp. NPDC002490 TaxID=3154416 RepID=UPI00332592F4
MGAPLPRSGPGASTATRPTAAWHARVDCGREVGAGFLVTARTVLTCAHVVRERAEAPVTVTFPQAAGLGPITARTVSDSGWGGGDLDPGDLAVLELPHEVPLAPVEFAAPEEGYEEPPPRLLLYGFPVHYDEGALAEYRVAAAQRIRDEWVQLEAWSGHGRPVSPGFSGAAVVLAGGGRAVGMVTSADGGSGARGARMLPAAVLARHWPPLADLIPTPGLTGPDRAGLRRLVAEAERSGAECVPDRLYTESVDPVTGPPLPPGGFRSLWQVLWYLLFEVADPAAPARFAGRLADFVAEPALRYALRRWAGFPDAPVAPARPVSDWTPIVVELERSGSGGRRFLAEVSTYRNGHRRLLGSRTLDKRALPRYVTELVDAAFHELPHEARVLIAFVLPRGSLNEPVAQWPRGPDDPSPLGCLYPVVVMDRERRRQGSLQHALLRKWRLLDERAARDGPVPADLVRVECGSTEDQGRLTVRLFDEGHVMAFTAPPTSPRMRRLFTAGLNGSVPVMLWPRTGCAGGHGTGEPCPGGEFLDRLRTHLADLPPEEIPHRVRALRRDAYLCADRSAHWARDLSLLWEDPRHFPEPPGHAASPVR